MLGNKVQEAFNEQLNAEYASSYLYLSMAAYAEAENLKGVAHWFRVQSQEELHHAMKIFEFVVDRGGRVLLTAIEAPATKWKSPLHLFEATLEHEQYVTKRIDKLVDLSIAENDHASHGFLQWFVNEQVEEEATVEEIIAQLKLVEGAPGGLFLLDRELAQRGLRAGTND